MLIFITHDSAFFLIGIGSTYLNKYFDDLAISNAQKIKCAEKASGVINWGPKQMDLRYIRLSNLPLKNITYLLI